MFRSFVIRLVIMTAAIAAVLGVTNFLIPFFHSFRVFSWISLLFFFVLTILTGYIGFRSLEKSPHGFVAGVNAIVMLKLFLSAIFIIVYIVAFKPDSAAFVVSFFIFYILFTVFEIRELVLSQKKQLTGKQRNNGQG